MPESPLETYLRLAMGAAYVPIGSGLSDPKPAVDLLSVARARQLRRDLDALAAHRHRALVESQQYGVNATAVALAREPAPTERKPAVTSPNTIISEDATEARPHYAKVQQEASDLFAITCDEGWRISIVCSDMCEWKADWLLGVLGRQPFAPGGRPVNPDTFTLHDRPTAPGEPSTSDLTRDVVWPALRAAGVQDPETYWLFRTAQPTEGNTR